jgi:phage I-like protein
MNTTILNRDFQHPSDGWYHIEPRGEHPNATAGVVQLIDEEAVREIVEAFNHDADEGALSHGGEMLIDHEHFSHDSSKETRAFGWLNRLQARADGIYGRVRWSKTGREAVDGGDYRFFSTEYDPRRCEEVESPKSKSAKSRRLRPLALAGLTLTNRPNNRGAKPITNRSWDGADDPLPDAPADSPAGGQADIQTRTKHDMKKIAQKLGLSADASEEAILGEVSRLLQRLAEAERQLAPVEDERDTLKNRLEELVGDQIAAELDAHGVRDEAVRQKLFPVLRPMTNRAERVDFLALLNHDARSTPRPLTNRQAARVPVGRPGTNSSGDASKAQLISNRAAQLQRDMPGLSTATAFITAQRAVENEIATGALK